MSKKDGQSQQALISETSRRTFLKTSAAVAGAALVGAAVKASPASAATQSKSEGTTPLQDVVARPDLWYYPGEEVAPDEMRVTLMGTGWGNIIRPAQMGASIFVELGNGDSFHARRRTRLHYQLQLPAGSNVQDEQDISDALAPRSYIRSRVDLQFRSGRRPVHTAGDLRPNRHDARARHQIQHRGRPEGAHQMEPGQLCRLMSDRRWLQTQDTPNSITSRTRVSPIRKTGSRSNTSRPFMSSMAPLASNWNGTD